MRPTGRFVIDTNVLVSALLTPKGHSRQVVTKANRSGFILQSEETFQEVEEVIYRPRFDRYVTDEERARFLQNLTTKSIFASVTEQVAACSDPDDDKFLELALSGGASCIVSGDDDLLVLNPFRGVAIMKPRAFLDWQPAQG